jgi:hypothetical protein
MGTGDLFYGLGQTALHTVDVAQQITTTQWNSLFTAMNNVANHTNDTLTSTEARVAGDLIEIKSALIADLQTLAASVAAGSTNATALTVTGAQLTSASGTRYNGSHIVEQSISFSNADQMRWFFNQGGMLQINISRTGNGATSGATGKDGSVDDLINSLGDFRIKSQTSNFSEDGVANFNTVSTNGLNIGFYDLNTSYQTILVLTQDATYTTMNFKFEAKLNASPGSSTVLTIKTSITDPDGGDEQYTSGNTSSVDQYANFIGTTNVILKFVNPTTAEGLATAYTPSSSALVSNNTV